MSARRSPLTESVLDPALRAIDRVMEQRRPRLAAEEVGRVTFVGHGFVRLAGLPGVGAEELLRFPGHGLGMAFNLDRDEVGAILLDDARQLGAGAEVRRAGRVLDVPVGEKLLGRVVDGVGRPLDGAGPMQTLSSASRTCFRSRSATEWTATVAIPSSWQERRIRRAISPRLAMTTFSSIS